LAQKNLNFRKTQQEAIIYQQKTQAQKNFREAEKLKQERAQHEEMIAI